MRKSLTRNGYREKKEKAFVGPVAMICDSEYLPLLDAFSVGACAAGGAFYNLA